MEYVGRIFGIVFVEFGSRSRLSLLLPPPPLRRRRRRRRRRGELALLAEALISLLFSLFCFLVLSPLGLQILFQFFFFFWSIAVM
jgi:hypothetical protein